MKGWLKKRNPTPEPQRFNTPTSDSTPSNGPPTTPSPAFPSAQAYTGRPTQAPSYNSYSGDILASQFDRLDIRNPQAPYPPVRRNNLEDGYRPSPNGPDSQNQTWNYVPASGTPVPSVLTPGNRQGLQQGQQPSPIDYTGDGGRLRNPLPQPPQMISFPEPQSYFSPYGLQPPARTSHPHSAPATESLPFFPTSSPSGSHSNTNGRRPSSSSNPPIATPGRHVRASSEPPSPTVATNSKGIVLIRCSGVKKDNTQCTRSVQAGTALDMITPNLSIPRYCHQHRKEGLAQSGYYTPSGKFVSFDDWIPSYLQEATKVALRKEMDSVISKSDEDGYIYAYELRNAKSPQNFEIKVGRAINLVKRIDQWTKSCESKEPILRGWYPGPDDGDVTNISLRKGQVKAGAKGKHCHRLERLIHLELADLVVFKPYLSPEFDDLTKQVTSTSLRSSATRGKVGKKKQKAKVKKRIDSDEDDDDDDEDEEDGEDVEEEDDAPVATRKKARKVRMVPRPQCEDCGAVHKEIFTFERPRSGPYKGREWDGLVRPVVEKWGDFVETCYS